MLGKVGGLIYFSKFSKILDVIKSYHLTNQYIKLLFRIFT